VPSSSRAIPGRALLKSPARQWTWLWLPVILYMIGIFVASSIADPPIPANVSDVSLHEIVYFGLTLLLIRALAKERWSGITATTLLLAFAIAVAYGVSDEWHQSFVPTRQAEIRDLRADAWGAFAATMVVGAWGIIRRL
jgi:VanZ family protein